MQLKCKIWIATIQLHIQRSNMLALLSSSEEMMLVHFRWLHPLHQSHYTYATFIT